MFTQHYRFGWPYLAAITLFWIAFCKPWFFDGAVIPYDAKNHFYAMVRFVASAYHSGQSAAWSPFHFGGHPMLADPQSVIMTPSLWPPILLSSTPSMALVDFFQLLHLLAVGFAIFGFSHSRKWHPLAGLIAAITALSGGALAMRLEHVLMIISVMWFCVALWRLDVLLQKGGLVRGLLFATPLSLMLVNRDHVAMLGAWFLLFYWLIHAIPAFWRDRQIKAAFIREAPVLAAGLVSIVAVAIPLLLLFQLAENSNRPMFGLELASWQSLHPISLMTFILPEYFGSLTEIGDYWGPASSSWPEKDLKMHRGMLHFYFGTFTIWLIIWQGIIKGGLFQEGARFFAAIALLMYFYSLGRYTPVFSVLYEVVPFLDLFRRPADGIFIFGIAISLLVGFLLDNAIRQKDESVFTEKKRWFLFAVIATPIFFTGVAIANEFDRTTHLLQALLTFMLIGGVTTAALLLGLHKRLWRPTTWAALLLLISFDLIHHNSNILANARPPAYYAQQADAARLPVFKKLQELLQEKDPSGVPWRVETLGLGAALQNVGQVLQVHDLLGYNPIRLAGMEMHIAPDMQNNAPKRRFFGDKMTGYDSHLTNQLGLRYLVLGTPIEAIDAKAQMTQFKLIFTTQTMDRDVYIYENKQAEARAIGVLKNGDKVAATVTSYTNTEIHVDIDASEEGHLILRDFIYEGWVAFVNGRPVAIERENDLFRKVPIGVGKNEVVFKFDLLTYDNLVSAVKAAF